MDFNKHFFQPKPFSFEYNLLPNFISNLNHCMDGALGVGKFFCQNLVCKIQINLRAATANLKQARPNILPQIFLPVVSYKSNLGNTPAFGAMPAVAALHLNILFNHTPEPWLLKSKCKRRKKKKKKPGREMVMWLMGTYPATRLPG